MEESSVSVGLDFSVDSIQYHLACWNVMGSDPQLFFLIIYLILAMSKWSAQPWGFIILMKAKLHQMTWREQDIFAKRTAKDKVMHRNLLTHLSPENVQDELVSQTSSSKLVLVWSKTKVQTNANQQGMYLKALIKFLLFFSVYYCLAGWLSVKLVSAEVARVWRFTEAS